MRLLNVIHVRDGSVGLGFLTEANETESTAATGVAVLDDDLHALAKSALGRLSEGDIQPLGPVRTPRTWCAGFGRQCAMQGLCGCKLAVRRCASEGRMRTR